VIVSDKGGDGEEENEGGKRVLLGSACEDDDASEEGVPMEASLAEICVLPFEVRIFTRGGITCRQACFMEAGGLLACTVVGSSGLSPTPS